MGVGKPLRITLFEKDRKKEKRRGSLNSWVGFSLRCPSVFIGV